MNDSQILRKAAIFAAMEARKTWHQMRSNPAISKYALMAREHMRANLEAARFHKRESGR